MNPSKRRYLPYAVALLALAALVMIALPSAQAQEASVDVRQDDFESTVEVTPFGTPVSRNVPVALDYTTGSAQPTTTVQVSTSKSGVPSWLSVTISPSAQTYRVEGTDATGGGTGDENQGTAGPKTYAISFAATKQAPAQQPVTVTIDFQADAGDTSGMETKGQKAEFTVTAEYFSIVSFQQPTPFQRIGPTEAANFPLKITNSGNGETLFNFEITQVGYDKWQVPTPSQLSVPSTQTGAETNTKQMNLQVTSSLSTGYYNDLGVVTMKMSPVFAPRPSHNPGIETAVSFLAHFQGMYVSMVGPAGVLAASGTALALVRRHQKG